jgi:glycosyltransferase involved in cell wall biosynthesis
MTSTKITNLISIIIPVYNAEEFIARALDSILQNEGLHLEVIAIDDGSTDDSHSILISYAEKDERVKVFTQNNKGVSSARNVGVENSTGKYITFLDADDLSNPGVLRRAYKKAEDTDADVVLCNYNWIFEDGYKRRIALNKKLIPENLPEVFSYKDTPGFIFQLVNNSMSSKLYRADFIKPIRLCEEIVYSEDVLFNTSVIAESAKFTILDEELFNYNRFHGGNTVKSFSVWNPNGIEYLFYLKKILDDAGIFNELIESYYKKIMNEIYLCIIKYEKLEDYYLFVRNLIRKGISKLGITDEGIDAYATKPQVELFAAIINEEPPPFSIPSRLYEKIDKLKDKNAKLTARVKKLKEKNEKLQKETESLRVKNIVQKEKVLTIEKNFGYRISRKLKRIFRL